MIKSFSQYINESLESIDFIKELSQKLIQKIKNSKQESEEYLNFSGMEFREPYEFDLKLNVKKNKDFTPKKDSHFKSLTWEKINFKEKGYAIDATVKINKDGMLIPEIEMHVVIDSTKEPHLYSDLYARILDILVHEINHVNQIGLKRKPHRALPSNRKERDSAKKSYKYFLLADEVESMVEGMYERSKVLDKPLDYIFDDYLIPFVQAKYITQSEYLKVLEAWVKKAIALHPDSNFSNKVKKIINSL
jgi:hypothetical protein